MALKTGLIGGDWEDYHDSQIQPLLDQYDQQINDVLANGAHGEIARMQAQDDALGSNAGGGEGDTMAGFSSTGGGQGQRYRTDFPIGDPGEGPQGWSNAGLSSNTFNQAGPQSAAFLDPSQLTKSVVSQGAAPMTASQTALGDNKAEKSGHDAGTSSPNGVEESKLLPGLAKSFRYAGGLTDISTALAEQAGRLGSGDQAVLNGLERTGRFLTGPLAAAEGVADTANEIGKGAPPTEAIIGNLVRGGLVYGSGVALGGIPGIAAGGALNYFLPSGAVIGHALVGASPSKFDFPTTVMLRAR